MTSVNPLEEKFEAQVRRALAPQRFPERRDVEIAFAGDAGHGFFDYMWRDERLLCAFAVRLEGQGLEGALELAALRHLVRAVVAATDGPEQAVEALHSICRAQGADIAIVQLDIVDGQGRSACRGLGRIALPDGALGAGALIWIAAGDGAGFPQADVAAAGLDALVASCATQAHGPVGAIHFKMPARLRDSATFTVPNDREEIPVFLDAARRFFARHEMGEEETMGLEVALDEILTNQVNYGFRDGLGHEVLVEMRAQPELLTIEIRDDGEPFDPLAVPKPDLDASIDDRQIGGLGMHFVTTLLDRVSYRRGDGWNILTLEKDRAQRCEPMENRP